MPVNGSAIETVRKSYIGVVTGTVTRVVVVHLVEMNILVR